MKKIKYSLFVLSLIFTISMAFNACSSDKSNCDSDKCEHHEKGDKKACCTDEEKEACKKEGKECCADKANKECCKDSEKCKHKEAVESTDSTNTSESQTHVCGDKCHTDGCMSHKEESASCKPDCDKECCNHA